MQIDWRSRLDGYRKAYAIAQVERQEDYDPYTVETHMTMIERGVWSDIRCFGLPFYPQYPVGRFVADFADPKKRIAIECDGAAYHNPVRDAARDREMEALGWSVIRIEGWRCNLPEEDERGATPIIRNLAIERYGMHRLEQHRDEEE